MIHDLDAKGICKIIEQCRVSGVQSFSMGEMQISFDSGFVYRPEPQSGVVDLTKFQTIDKEIEEQGQEQISAKLGQDYLDTLLLEDPERYEELVSNGEFEQEESSDA